MVYAVGCLIAYVVWVYLHRFEIRPDGRLYLVRYKLIRTPWFRVFLHNILLPDAGRELHNHPWPFAGTFVLSGGYIEHIMNPDTGLDYMQGLLPGHKSYSAFRPGRYHRIVRVAPGTWTLFFAGRRSRSWGFLVDGRHIDHETYLGYKVKGD